MERLNRLTTPLTVFCLCSFIAVTGQGEVVGIGTGTAVAPEEVKDYYIDPVCSREVYASYRILFVQFYCSYRSR